MCSRLSVLRRGRPAEAGESLVVSTLTSSHPIVHTSATSSHSLRPHLHLRRRPAPPSPSYIPAQSRAHLSIRPRFSRRPSTSFDSTPRAGWLVRPRASSHRLRLRVRVLGIHPTSRPSNQLGLRRTRQRTCMIAYDRDAALPSALGAERRPRPTSSRRGLNINSLAGGRTRYGTRGTRHDSTRRACARTRTRRGCNSI